MERLVYGISLVNIMMTLGLGIGISLAQSSGIPPDQPSAQPEKVASEDSGGLTMGEIINLKKAGISDVTIQLLITNKELPQKMKEQAFAQEHIGTWNIRDSQGKEAIVYSTGKNCKECYDELEYLRALELLRAMRPRPIIRSDQEPTPRE